MIATQLSIFLENKPGVLSEVCKALAAHDIDILGMSISDTVDHAVVRLVVDDPQAALHILGDHGALVVETEVLAMKVADRPGELAKIAAKFARGKVNIEYAYGTAEGGNATLYLRVSDTKKAVQLLTPKRKAKRKKTRS